MLFLTYPVINEFHDTMSFCIMQANTLLASTIEPNREYIMIIESPKNTSISKPIAIIKL
uniref:Uncharacterized protein n=1 Tax=Arundo donax TaxID=35708 RepID=A0A0A9HH84_ARUDO